jgi:hypothetical protein
MVDYRGSGTYLVSPFFKERNQRRQRALRSLDKRHVTEARQQFALPFGMVAAMRLIPS